MNGALTYSMTVYMLPLDSSPYYVHCDDRLVVANRGSGEGVGTTGSVR